MIVKNEQIVLVINEHGGMEGIVTLEDVLETLIGLEIVDETDRYKDMQILARKVWKEKTKENK
jgi:CBS domain containing-hemolysin-like protein